MLGSLSEVVEEAPKIKQTVLPNWRIQQDPRLIDLSLVTGREIVEKAVSESDICTTSPVEETTVSEVRPVRKCVPKVPKVFHYVSNCVINIEKVTVVEEVTSEEGCSSVRDMIQIS